MIRARIRYIFNNFNKKPSIYDYMHEPVFFIEKDNIRDAKHVARAVFNSIKVGEDKKSTKSLYEYRKYKMKHNKNKMRTIENVPK